MLNNLSFISISNPETILNYIKKNQFTGEQKIWKNKTQAWTIETKEFQELRDIIIAIKTPFIIEQCDKIIASISKKVSYMGPIRATAQRYYRIQDLAVDEVDYQGQNLAMFFGNLNDSEKENFAKWTHQYFGFELYTNSSFGHISLEIKSEHSSDEKINIADTGFGFSQILPVITQLWLISSALPQRRQMQEAVDSSPVIFAVEQPELHLHPRLQGVLTDAFVKSIKAAKDNRVDLRLVIETHSEVLVNRLGDLVAEDLISSDDINIVLFEPSDEPNKVNVKISEFNFLIGNDIKMLIKIDSSLVKNLNNELAYPLHLLAIAQSEGKHIIIGDRNTLQSILKCNFLDDRSKQIYQKILDKVSYLPSYLSAVSRYIEVINDCPEPKILKSSGKQVIQVSPKFFNDSETIQPRIIMIHFFMKELPKSILFGKN